MVPLFEKMYCRNSHVPIITEIVMVIPYCKTIQRGAISKKEYVIGLAVVSLS